MRIRSKIFLLVASSVLFMILIGVVYISGQIGSARIEAERRVLLGLNDAVKDLIASINLLDSGQIDASFNRFKKKREQVDASFAAVAKLSELPRMDASLKEAIEIVGNLGALAKEDLDKLAPAFEELEGDVLKYFMMTSVSTLRLFYTDAYVRGKYNLAEVFFRLDALDSLSAGLTDTLITLSDVIGEKNLLVDGVIASTNQRGFILQGGLALVLVIGSLILAFIFSRSLARPVIAIERAIGAVSGGDLTVRAHAGGKDEVGALGANLNAFLSSLSASIGEIKEVSRENLELKALLGDAVAGASSSATEIGASAESIRRRIEDLDERISGTRASLESMTKGIVEYAARVVEEDGMVYKSTQSVEGMLSSLASIASLAERDREASGRLEKAATEGRVVFADTFDKLSGIAKSVDAITEMARVIADIASRTNLLAMNAAIEAAHAGQSGKGFAVVADEIRKLAAAASESSRRIGETIGSISELGRKAAGSRDKAASTFGVLDAQIGSVASSAREVDGLIVGIRTEAQALIGVMRSLREASKRSAEGASSIEQAAISVGTTVSDVARVSSEVNSNSSEITVGLGEIATAVAAVSNLADKIGDSGTRLDAAINSFKTDVA